MYLIYCFHRVWRQSLNIIYQQNYQKALWDNQDLLQVLFFRVLFSVSFWRFCWWCSPTKLSMQIPSEDSLYLFIYRHCLDLSPSIHHRCGDRNNLCVKQARCGRFGSPAKTSNNMPQAASKGEQSLHQTAKMLPFWQACKDHSTHKLSVRVCG